MSVKLRLKRMGRKNRAFYRLNAMDARSPRDGRIIEELGYYDPIEKDPAKAVKVDVERAKYWIGVGAQPSDTVADLLRKLGLTIARKQKSIQPPPRQKRKKAEA